MRRPKSARGRRRPAHAGNAAPDAEDYLAVDLLAQDGVRPADVAGSFGRDRSPPSAPARPRASPRRPRRRRAFFVARRLPGRGRSAGARTRTRSRRAAARAAPLPAAPARSGPLRARRSSFAPRRRIVRGRLSELRPLFFCEAYRLRFAFTVTKRRGFRWPRRRFWCATCVEPRSRSKRAPRCGSRTRMQARLEAGRSLRQLCRQAARPHGRPSRPPAEGAQAA